MLKFWRKIENRQVLMNNVAKIGEMRMTSCDKRDPVEFILFLILKSLFVRDRGGFGDLSTDSFVLIFTVLKMIGQFRRVALEQCIRRANASQMDGLTLVCSCICEEGDKWREEDTGACQLVCSKDLFEE